MSRIHRQISALIAIGIALSVTASLRAQGHYPRVYGPTGHLYGPTQAHYQYERQYGHPWHGGGVPLNPNGAPGPAGAGFAVSFPPFWGPYGFGGYGYGGYGYGGYYGGGYGVPGFGYGWGGYGVPGYGLYGQYQWGGVAPRYLGGFMTQGHELGGPTSVVSPPWPEDPAIYQRDQVNGPRPERVEAPRRIESEPSQSSPEQIEQASRLLNTGDELLQQGNHREALSLYQQAIQIAPDQGEPRIRASVLLAESRRYREAIHEIRTGLSLDPSTPVTGVSLSVLFGVRQEQHLQNLLQSTAQWARGDIRDPERLFLIGVLLHLNGDRKQAEIPLTSAARLAPGDQQILAFLKAKHAPSAAVNPIQQTGNVVPAPLPESPNGSTGKSGSAEELPSSPVRDPESEPAGNQGIQPVPKRKVGTPASSTVPSPPPVQQEQPPVPAPEPEKEQGVPEQTGSDSGNSGPAFPEASSGS